MGAPEPRRDVATAADERPAEARDLAAETAIVNRARLGDAAAFAEIVRMYHPRALRFARSMLRDTDEAEDVVQDAFIRVFRALPRYEERQRFQSWFFHILGNCCRSANSSARHREAVSLHDTDLDQRVAGPDRADARLDGEFGADIRRALAELPPHNREVFLLHYIEGFSYEEIERITGVRRSALKMRVKRAADQLRQRLQERRSD
jgi:RNA polymerase sigma-70 factor (ECF subfamily)